MSINLNTVDEVYSYYYEQYKRDYNNGNDFTIESNEDIEDIEGLLQDFDFKLKGRNYLSNSIYEELLDQYVIVTHGKTIPSDISKKKSKRFSETSQSRKIQISTRDVIESRLEDKIKSNTSKDSNESSRLRTSEMNMTKFNETNMHTADYELSQSNIKNDNNRSNSVMRNSDLLISNQHIFDNEDFESSILKKSMEKILSDVSDSEEEQIEKSKLNESIDMDAINQIKGIFKRNSDPINIEVSKEFLKESRSSAIISSSNDRLNPIQIRHLDSITSDKTNSQRNSLVSSSREITSSPMNNLNKFFENIHSLKLINLKSQYFDTNLSSSIVYVEDPFIVQFLKICQKEKFFNSDAIKELKTQFKFRYEIFFFEICKKYMCMKLETSKNIKRENTMKFIKDIITLLNDINTLMRNQEFILNSNSLFILKPLTLLKLWDNSSEDNDISTYAELVKYFYIKILLKCKDVNNLYKAFNQIKEVFIKENAFDKAKVFTYYFGKVIALVIQNISQIKNKDALEIFDRDEKENYNKIKTILSSYGRQSLNYKRKAKNYSNLAKISEYFNADVQKVEYYLKKFKQYNDFLLDPNKLIIRDSNKHSDNREESVDSY